MTSFLYCNPTVFVIDDCYEILVLTKENGVISIKVEDKTFYEENSGVLSSEKNYAKIRIPQSILNTSGKYSICFKKTINREAYYSKLEESVSADFELKVLTKENNINMFHIADIHYRFDLAKKTCEIADEDLDLFIVNGDMGEVETIVNYYDVISFLGSISKGYIPVVMSRGNHDTRGKLAELYTNFFPSNNYKTYYSFQFGNLRGIVLDCGEDKPDKNIEYGGVNIFHAYREKELEFLRGLTSSNAFTFAISHICPSHTARVKGNEFDIEQDMYRKWNLELDRLNIKFMLSAHMHKTYILNKTTERSTIEHNYPVIMGSGHFEDDIWGTYLTIKDNEVFVKFTYSNLEIREEYVL